MKHLSALIFGMFITLLSTSTYAAGASLPEGVYVIDGETVIVDLTAPTGNIQVDTAESASANSFKNAHNVLLKPSAVTLNSVIQAHDNFEENGSFKEWKILRKTGTISGSPWANCDFTGAPVQTLTQGNPHYSTNPAHLNTKQTDNAGGAPISVTVQDSTTTHGNCYSYQLFVEDNAGNTLNTNETGSNGAGNWSAPIFVDDTSTGAPKLTIIAIPVDPSTGADLPADNGIITNNSNFQGTNGTTSGTVSSAWSKKDIKLSWSSIDAESGIHSVSISHTRNGVAQTWCGKKGDGSVQSCGNISLADIANYNGGYFSTHDLVSSNEDEGVHVVTITVTDASGNTTVSVYTVNIDKTSPSLSWNNTSSDGNPSGQLAGVGAWTFGFDDLNNGNKSSSGNANYVAKIQRDAINIQYDKCLDDACTTSSNLVSITGNTVTESDTTWVDVLDAFNWNNLDANNTLTDKQVEIKHSKYFGGTATGKYKISYTLTDQAGNQSTLSKVITVEPNQMDTTNSSLSLAAGCNNGSWNADASSTCSVTATLQDMYQNPLYNRSDVNIDGKSDTSFDQIHMPNPDTNDSYEGVFFSNAGTVDTEGKGIRVANSFTTGTNGSVSFDLVAYAPTWTAGEKLDFTIATKPHTAMNYASGGSGSYTVTDQENAKAYRINQMLSLTSLDAPAFFQKNATQSFNALIANTIGGNATNERIGLYIYAKLTGAYDFLNMDSAASTESSTAWVNNGTATEKTNAQTSLGVSSFNYDGAAVYSQNDSVNGAYTFQVRASKKTGVQSFDTTVDIKPFARMTITRDGVSKEVAYPLISLAHDNIPLYNQATETQGAGLVQGSGNDVNAGDAASQSSSQISIQTLTTQLKETVKKELINITDLSGINSTEIRTLSDFDIGVKRINNGHSYIVKGDNQDLVITGVNGVFSIGSEPLSFVTYGGNIIIKANIQYTSSTKPTIAFISLRNESSGTGGEVRVMNTASNGLAITNLVGSFFSERGMVGADASNNTDITPESRQTALTHQLLIQGSVMGGNTLGGGDDPLTCPSFIRKASCLEATAQKYDLNYLRRYVPGTPATHTPAPASGSDKPVVIQYYMNKELLPQELLLNK